MREGSLQLSPRHYLEYDPDILVLQRNDGSVVAAFSALGANPYEIRKTAEQDDTQELSLRKRKAPSPRVESDNPRLWVRFFGCFDMVCCGRAVPLGRNGKALIILKYLLAHKPPSVSQDRLMGWLWPEAGPERARWSLNSTVRHLRELLSNCLGRARSDVLMFRDGHYYLSPDIEVLTDVDEFDAHYEQGRRLEKARRAEEAAAEYEKAMKLYRGDYLVEDLYEDWTMIERDRLTSAYMDILDAPCCDYLQGKANPRRRDEGVPRFG